jgi:hypothetical protein
MSPALAVAVDLRVVPDVPAEALRRLFIGIEDLIA